MDRVQIIKVESPALGGTEEDAEYTPIEPQEDAIEAAGFYGQDASNRDETTLIFRDGDDWKFKDSNNPGGYTLSQLAASGSNTKLISVSFATGDEVLGLVGSSNDYELRGSVLWPGSTYMGTPASIKVGGVHSNASGTGYVKVYDLTNALQIAEGTVTGTSWGIHDLGTLSNIASGEAIWEIHLKVAAIGGSDGELLIGTLQVKF